MKSLLVIVGHVLRNDVAEMWLSEEDEVAQTLVLDCSNEALSVWIAIGTLRRNLDACDALRTGVDLWPENRLEVRGEERISVVNEMGGVALPWCKTPDFRS